MWINYFIGGGDIDFSCLPATEKKEISLGLLYKMDYMEINNFINFFFISFV